MKKSKSYLKGFLPRISRTAVIASLLLAGFTALTVTLDANSPQRLEAQNADQGWGSEALSQVYSGIAAMSPIPLANACGLGASSCFKCHNGTRAAAPAADAATSPWHHQHLKVNNSCVGCHQGNPRLMKEQMAHKDMLADPRTDLQKACGTCHSGDNLETLSKNYLTLQGNK